MFEKYANKQKVAVDTLTNAILNHKLSHAYIFETNNYKDSYNFVLDFIKYIVCPNSTKEGHDKNCGICTSIDNDNYRYDVVYTSDTLSLLKHNTWMNIFFYENDIRHVRKVLADIINNYQLIQKDPEPFIGVVEHAQNSVNFGVRVWCEKEDYWTVYYYLLEQVKIRFDEENISIPYPQMDLHVKHS